MEKLIKSIDKILEPNGVFVFDGLTKYSKKDEVKEPAFRYKYNHPEKGEVSVFYTNQFIDNTEELIMYYKFADGSIHIENRKIEYYDINTVMQTIKNCGYKIRNSYSDYEKTPLYLESPMFIVEIIRG